MTHQKRLAKAQEVADILGEVSKKIAQASRILEDNDLNLSNYPQNWESLDELPEMIRNIFVDNWEVGKPNHIQIMVGN